MSLEITKKLTRLSLEEKILNTSACAGFVCIFFPWVGGEWLGGSIVTYSGFGFFTSFIGLAIAMLLLYSTMLTLLPLLNGPQIVRKDRVQKVRLFTSVIATILTLAAWSVLTKFTLEFSRLQIHFGLYGTMVGTLITSLYSFMLYKESKKESVRSIFEHSEPETQQAPPPPEQPEEYRNR